MHRLPTRSITYMDDHLLALAKWINCAYSNSELTLAAIWRCALLRPVSRRRPV